MWKEILIYSAAGMLAFVLFAIWFVIRKLLIRVYQPKIFISYRRTDQKSTGVPERLYEDLCGRYGPDNVFKDTHDIQAGERYPDVLSGWLAISDVIVAVIGENWAGENEANRPRILNVIQNSGDKNDWVRHEVEVASNKNRLLVVLAKQDDNSVTPRIPTYSIENLVKWNSVEEVKLIDDLAKVQSLIFTSAGPTHDRELKKLCLAIEKRKQMEVRFYRRIWAGLIVPVLIGCLFCFWLANNAMDTERLAAEGKEMQNHFKDLEANISRLKPIGILPMSADEMIRKMSNNRTEVQVHNNQYVIWNLIYVGIVDDFPKYTDSLSGISQYKVAFKSPSAENKQWIYGYFPKYEYDRMKKDSKLKSNSTLNISGAFDFEQSDSSELCLINCRYVVVK